MGGGRKRRRKRAKGGKKGPILSLCMIVKDEAERLGRCLESLSPLKPEIIVVDTGSTDGTQQVARRFGARVISFPWGDDFSAARNRSIKEARGRWILILDADEVIATEDLPLLRNLLHAPGVAAYSVVTRNYCRNDWMAGWQPCQGQYPEMEEGLSGWFPSEKIRLFKRHPSVRFEGAVHEMVESSIEGMGGRIVPCPVPVHHFGPAGDESRRPKTRYYLRLALKKLRRERDDPQSWMEVGSHLFELGRFRWAEGAFQRVVELHERSSRSPAASGPAAVQALNMLGALALGGGEAQEAAALFNRALQIDPTFAPSRHNLDTALKQLSEENQSDAGDVSVHEETAITLCLIVRNEEEDLPGCLEDFGPLADQIVVVDTGSDDETVSVARRYGAEVHHHPWQDDFSEARNWSLDYARGRMIIWADADDRLEPGSAEALRREILSHEGKAIYCVLRTLEVGGAVTRSYQLRAFPNNPAVRFEGRIHEQVAWAVERLKLPSVRVPVEIIHTGYADSEAIQRKFQRNRTLLEEQIRQDPDDLYAHYMLARTLEGLGDEDAAAQWCSRLLAHPKAGSGRYEFLLHTQALLAQYCCRLGVVDEGRRLLEDLVAREPEFALGRLLLGELDAKTGFFLEACNALLPLLENEPQPSLIPVDPGEIVQKASRHLGVALIGLGQWTEARGCLQRALELRPDDQETLPLLAEAFMLEGRLEEAEEAFLACDGADPMVWMQLGTIALRRGDLDTAEERLNTAASAGLDSAHLDNNLGLLMDRRGRWREAEHHYMHALARKPNMMEPLLNLGHGLLNEGRWEEAGGFFRRALDLEPELLDARLAAAALAFSNGDLDRAHTLADQLWLELAPDESTPKSPPSDPSSLFVLIGERLRGRGQDPLVELCHRLATGLNR